MPEGSAGICSRQTLSAIEGIRQLQVHRPQDRGGRIRAADSRSTRPDRRYDTVQGRGEVAFSRQSSNGPTMRHRSNSVCIFSSRYSSLPIIFQPTIASERHSWSISLVMDKSAAESGRFPAHSNAIRLLMLSSWTTRLHPFANQVPDKPLSCDFHSDNCRIVSRQLCIRPRPLQNGKKRPRDVPRRLAFQEFGIGWKSRIEKRRNRTIRPRIASMGGRDMKKASYEAPRI